MLSRLALRAVQNTTRPTLRVIAVRGNATAAEDSERDLVNFPRRTRPIEKAPVRLGFLPEEWFTFFYDKTGATGGYMFLASSLTFLMSKEYIICEHEYYTGLALYALYGSLIYKFGPGFTEWINKEVEADDAKLKAVRQGEIEKCKTEIAEEEKAQWMATSYEALIAAKKENVALQLEAEYRKRLQDAYRQVKTRLDYQLETGNVLRRAEQKYMVDWIINGVKKSITAKQEEDALKKCISDLKAMA